MLLLNYIVAVSLIFTCVFLRNKNMISISSGVLSLAHCVAGFVRFDSVQRVLFRWIHSHRFVVDGAMYVQYTAEHSTESPTTCVAMRIRGKNSDDVPVECWMFVYLPYDLNALLFYSFFSFSVEKKMMCFFYTILIRRYAFDHRYIYIYKRVEHAIYNRQCISISICIHITHTQTPNGHFSSDQMYVLLATLRHKEKEKF